MICLSIKEVYKMKTFCRLCLDVSL